MLRDDAVHGVADVGRQILSADLVADFVANLVASRRVRLVPMQLLLDQIQQRSQTNFMRKQVWWGSKFGGGPNFMQKFAKQDIDLALI